MYEWDGLTDMANVKLKLLYVLNLLLDSDEHHTINATQIVKQLAKEHGINTERKSVCRDIATLQTYGHDIIAPTTSACSASCSLPFTILAK